MRIFVIVSLILACFVTSHSYAQKKKAEAARPQYSFDRWQVLIGQNHQTMISKEVDAAGGSNSSEKNMTGENFGFYFGAVKQVNAYFEWQAHVGYENFSVLNSATKCPSSSAVSCSVEISYLSLGVMPRLKVGYERLQVWSGVSLNLKQPLGKKATAILSDEIQTTSSYGFALGLDVFMDANFLLPIEIEQQFFLKSDTVEARQLLLKIGLGHSF